MFVCIILTLGRLTLASKQDAAARSQEGENNRRYTKRNTHKKKIKKKNGKEKINIEPQATDKHETPASHPGSVAAYLAGGVPERQLDVVAIHLDVGHVVLKHSRNVLLRERVLGKGCTNKRVPKRNTWLPTLNNAFATTYRATPTKAAKLSHKRNHTNQQTGLADGAICTVGRGAEEKKKSGWDRVRKGGYGTDPKHLQTSVPPTTTSFRLMTGMMR